MSIWIGELNKEGDPPSVGAIIQSSEGPIEHEKQRKGKYALCLNWDSHILLPSDFVAPRSQASGLHWNHTAGAPGPPARKWWTLGPLSLQNHVSHLLIIFWFLYISINILFVLYFWKTLIKKFTLDSIWQRLFRNYNLDHVCKDESRNCLLLPEKMKFCYCVR